MMWQGTNSNEEADSSEVLPSEPPVSSLSLAVILCVGSHPSGESVLAPK